MKKLLTILIIICLALGQADAATRKKRSTTRSRKARTTRVTIPKAPVLPAPRTSGTFVKRLDAPEAPAGLDGRNIALWASHGRYFDSNEGRWNWQRARLHGTVEDLFSSSFVLPYLIPMLENSGAYVLTPRERDTSSGETIVDADGGAAAKSYSDANGSNKWETVGAGYALRSKVLSGGENPFRGGTSRRVATIADTDRHSEESVASWDAVIEEPGRKEGDIVEKAVYVSYQSSPQSAPDARYRVNSLRGTEEFEVNQTMGGGTWVYLGTFPFRVGSQELPVVELTNRSSQKGRTVSADAVKIGGGMGTIAREGEVSGDPKFLEGARYWLQWAGMPASVWAAGEGKGDYQDDLKSRGKWVNYLAGGSRTNPAGAGLGIPVDMAFALHTDAGMTDDPSATIGTLPIVSTQDYWLGDGRRRTTSTDLANFVTNQVVSDIQSIYDPTWNRRPLRDRAYNEAREPVVPAMLLELLSHQNYGDMRLGLSPEFRFDVSRSIYKGILKYLHSVAGTPYVVAPLPVKDMKISGADGKYTLSWLPTPDPLEPTAKASYFIVYERRGDGAFTELAVVDDPRISLTPPSGVVCSYKVVAVNDGGKAFPSETLALCDMPGSELPQVTVVNGFTRISGPAFIGEEFRRGADYDTDFGVPYMTDIHFTGRQTSFAPGEEWINNDDPGYGASDSDFEQKLVAGNTFDYVAVHGEALRDAGAGFISESLSSFLTSTDTPRIVDLILGLQRQTAPDHTSRTKFKAFDTALQLRLTKLAAAGTSLLISGSYIASDLFDNPFSTPETAHSDQLFAAGVLGMSWGEGSLHHIGEAHSVKSRYEEFEAIGHAHFAHELSAESYAVTAPDLLRPDPSDGQSVMVYADGKSIAATAFDPGNHRTVCFGFPIEAVSSDKERAAIMKSALAFFTAPKNTHHVRAKVVPETMDTPDKPRKRKKNKKKK